MQLWFWSRLDIAPFFIKVHREEYKVKLLNGQTHQFIQTINSIRDVGDYLQNQFLSLQFPQAIAKLQRNETLDFSCVRMDNEGIHRGKKFLSWADLETAQVVSARSGRNIYVSLVIAKKGQSRPWAAFPRERFANLSLFLVLVHAIQQHTLSRSGETTPNVSLSNLHAL